MSDNRTKIIKLLRSTKRPGIEEVISWLDTDPSFYVASAARIHHDNVVGGLASHSLKVYEHARKMFITSIMTVIPHGMRKTSAKVMACALSICSRNSACHLRPMSVWLSGGTWVQVTRCLNPIILKSMPLPCKTPSAS